MIILIMLIDKMLYFKNRNDWRKWLTKNYDKQQSVWLIHYKKHSNKPGVNHFEAVEEAICFGWIDGKLKSLDSEKFILRYSPRKSYSIWSKINKDKALELIRQGKMTVTGYKKIEEAKQNGTWDNAYTNIKKERLPSDLKSALLKNKTAWRNFNNFANSYRNMYIGWVKNAKTDITRQNRISEVVNRSIANKKPGI